MTFFLTGATSEAPCATTRFLSSRLAAGEPLTQDFLKCGLKPVARSEYARPLTDAQFARLQTIFPSGACDYSQRPVGQQVVKDTWLSY